MELHKHLNPCLTLALAMGVLLPAGAVGAQEGIMRDTTQSRGPHVTAFGGLEPNPIVVPLQVNGTNNAADWDLPEGCTGYIHSNPDFTLMFGWTGEGLHFFFQGDGDTTLMVRRVGSRGAAYCNDDTAGVNPQVGMEVGQGAKYGVWVGRVNPGEEINGTLVITTSPSIRVTDSSEPYASAASASAGSEAAASSEGESPTSTGNSTSGLAIGGSESNFGSRSLSGGFMPDPSRVAITSGGSIAVNRLNLSPGCVGNVTRQPDFILNYSNARSFLRFFVRAANGDTTLVINDAAGRWHCNDDSNGGQNPQVDIRNPQSGQYDIWVGSYNAGQNVAADLFITEMQSQTP